MARTWQLQVDRSDLTRTQVVTSPNEKTPLLAEELLAEGAVLFHIDSFALTANNVTYGVFGDSMNYWQFFTPQAASDQTIPDQTPLWGVVPVWGFADVEASSHPNVKVGDRYYGFWPSGSHLTVEPTRLTESGFVDGTVHRRELPAIYNSYNLIDNDPLYDQNTEGLQSLLRPLFTTSFFIDDLLADNDLHGAETVLVSSASSKTAFALAFCLQLRGTPVIGLTSASNAEFVGSLGWYDEVLTYEQLANEECPALVAPMVYVDMSGDSAVRSNIHLKATDLRFDLMVGATHWDSPAGDPGLPGPTPEFFFAPTQISKRAKDWGSQGIADAMADSWNAFVPQVEERLRVEQRRGADACQSAYLSALDGSADPAVGVIISAKPDL